MLTIRTGGNASDEEATEAMVTTSSISANQPDRTRVCDAESGGSAGWSRTEATSSQSNEALADLDLAG